MESGEWKKVKGQSKKGLNPSKLSDFYSENLSKNCSLRPLLRNLNRPSNCFYNTFRALKCNKRCMSLNQKLTLRTDWVVWFGHSHMTPWDTFNGCDTTLWHFLICPFFPQENTWERNIKCWLYVKRLSSPSSSTRGERARFFFSSCSWTVFCN